MILFVIFSSLLFAPICYASLARFVAAGGGGTFKITWSDDGTTWNGVTDSTFWGNGRGCGFSPVLQRYVCVGEGNANSQNIFYSNDGKSWSAATGTAFQAWGYSVTWGRDRFVAGGLSPGPQLLNSFDGITWSVTGSNFFGRRAWRASYSPAQDKWMVAGGSSGTTMVTARGNDTDLQWNLVTDPIFSANQAFSLKWIDPLNVWVGAGDGLDVAIAFSKDGLTWTPSSSNKTILGQGQDADYFNGRLLVVGTNFTTSGAVSTDGGATFTPLDIPISPFVFRLIYSTCLDLWIACGYSDAPVYNSMAISKDGDHFVGLGNGTLVHCYGIASLPESIAPALVPVGTTEASRCNARVLPFSQSLVQGSYISESSLVVPVSSTLVVANNATVTVLGPLQVAGTLSVDALAKVTVQSLLVTSNTSALVVDMQSLVKQAQITPSTTTTATVVTSSQAIQGTFSSVRVVGIANSDCVTFNTPTTTVTSSTLSVTVTFVNTCVTDNSNAPSAPRLTTGAIVGIAIGTVAAAVILIVGVVFIIKLAQHRQTQRLQDNIRKNEMQGAMSPMLA